MQSLFLRNVGVALVMFGSLVHPAMADEDDISPQALSYLKKRFATITVAVEHAPLYGAVEPNAQPIISLALVTSLDVDASRLASAPAGWIPIKALGHMKGRKENVPKGWVRRRDVVIPGDYKKVIGCWPVKSATYVGGDYSAEVTFKVDGSAIVKERGDEAWINKQPSHKAHVYMARTVVVIETVKKGGPAFFTSAYRPGERRLYPEGAPAKEQELFSDELLKDCKSVPLLEQ